MSTRSDGLPGEESVKEPVKEPLKEPAATEGTSSGLTLGELSGAAFVNAYEEFCHYMATDYTAPAGHASTVEQFTLDAEEFGWRFTPAGELIDETMESESNASGSEEEPATNDDDEMVTIDELTEAEIELWYDAFVENLSLEDFVQIARDGGWRFDPDREYPG